ncbi:MAG TPA: hypothetical protein VE869_17425 [Gemmatimonas sp.]|nr:hypothetical protein [Gemmatimonas sp.]
MPDHTIASVAVDAVLPDSATPISARTSAQADSPATAGSGQASAFRAVLRALRPLVGHGAIDAAGTAMALERFQRSDQAPNISACRQLEPLRAYPIASAAAPRVRGFLDGIQRSRVVGHLRGSPLVHGTVAAVVRVRENRQLATWREPRVRTALYVARPQLGEPLWADLTATGLDIVDICASNDPAGSNALPPHPMATRARALELIALERETVERRLAAEWCRAEHDWLWIDGGISGNLAIDESACAFGVVKSHTTLYGDEETIRATLALRAGERSPVFLAGHRPRRAVASWYLRLRDGADGDPLHGLVRVEVAPSAALLTGSDDAPDGDAVGRLGAHADALSSWILAERAPLSRPDPRWDTLTYGVHACENYLKAIVGQ